MQADSCLIVFLYYLILADVRIGSAAEYLGMSVVGVRKAAVEGRLPFRWSTSGQRLFDQADLDAYLGRPAAPDANGGQAIGWMPCTAECLVQRAKSRRWITKNRCCEIPRRGRQVHVGAGGVAGSPSTLRGGLDRTVLVSVWG
jgi:hypothetical protein